MSKHIFKEGDLVYCSNLDRGLHRLVSGSCDLYPIRIKYEGKDYTYTKDGRGYIRDNVPVVFLATEENRLALETLYGVSFEPAPLKGSAKTRKLLIDSEKGSRVLCVVSDASEEEARYALRIRVIHDVTSHHRPFQDQHGANWAYAVPLNEVDTGCLGVHADE